MLRHWRAVPLYHFVDHDCGDGGCSKEEEGLGFKVTCRGERSSSTPFSECSFTLSTISSDGSSPSASTLIISTRSCMSWWRKKSTTRPEKLAYEELPPCR